MGLVGVVELDAERAVAAQVDAAALDEACLGFHRRHPRRSARRRLYVTQLFAAIVLASALVWALASAPQTTLGAVHLSALILFAVAVSWRLIAASNLTRILWRLAAPEEFPVYTILCPLYREANVVSDLVASLAKLDYPSDRLDIKLLIEADDAETVAAALAMPYAPHLEVILIPPHAPRTKPKALNVGLARATGAFVTVYDAEDRPHPQQLRAALAAFEDGGEDLACVQAPLRIDNGDASWIARQFAAEYAIQFREMLPLLARLGLPLPLGGSSNHFRTEVLRQCGGWDPFNVTEDADLGYRLARDGYRCDVIGPPTSEEAPITLKAWLSQRSRWIKGHMQTWLVLMRDPVRVVREMGFWSFASMQLMLAGGLVAAFVHGPLAFIVLTAMLSPYDLLAPADFILAVCGYCVAAFAALTATGLSGDLRHVRAALTMPAYWPLSTLAAFSALWELVLRPHHWSKTAHGVSPREDGLSRSSQSRAASKPHIASISGSEWFHDTTRRISPASGAPQL
jgi:cellulose synthase/poly-beta-1,6-N-acetylglucosamine synthase-like glycosyltransferase